MDYSRYALNGKFYGGESRKKGILIDEEDYIVKFAKDATVSHLSEYIAAHLFEHAGVRAGKTMLGTCDKEPVVVIKDFLEEGEYLASFEELREKYADLTGQELSDSFEGIETALGMLTGKESTDEIISWLWNVYIVDAWIGMPLRKNDDRGLLLKEKKYYVAPVFGNSDALFPDFVTDDELQQVLQSQEELNRCIYGEKSSYYDVINSLGNEACNEALMRIYEKIDMEWVKHFINGMEGISSVRKEFYVTILQERYSKMLEEPYRRLSRVMNIRRLMSVN